MPRFPIVGRLRPTAQQGPPAILLSLYRVSIQHIELSTLATGCFMIPYTSEYSVNTSLQTSQRSPQNGRYGTFWDVSGVGLGLVLVYFSAQYPGAKVVPSAGTSRQAFREKQKVQYYCNTKVILVVSKYFRFTRQQEGEENETTRRSIGARVYCEVREFSNFAAIFTLLWIQLQYSTVCYHTLAR